MILTIAKGAVREGVRMLESGYECNLDRREPKADNTP